ncbi:MOSC N-terminal beta barrel domain-containing protein [Thalassotalea euphylliae]|uniref:MOSC N-terminal beta barrel domain-containing protein n=1 Tax=Thalassotalea euphylliae TaxID=1655234 RepID=UPI00362BC1AE
MAFVQLEQISVYPIKSSAGIDLSSSWVDNIGLPFDRRFVVCDSKGQFITARTLPKMCLIQANLTHDGLVLTAPDMPLLHVQYQQCLDEYQHVTVWNDTILGQRCHEAVDHWFSQYIGQPVRLLYFGEQSTRHVKNSSNPVAFADGYPLLLISQGSLDELNRRLKHNVTMKHFRPNLVVSGCEPFAEDGWKHIRIGEVEFELTKPCSRCIFTTVEPTTAEKHPQMEPLSTLKSFRQVESGDVMFGQNIIPLNKGQVKQGDQVSVLSTQAPPAFVLSKKKTSSTNNEQFSMVCSHIYDETHDVKTFVFKPKKGDMPSFIAGQHLPFKLNINGKKTNAVYTISSCPSRPETLSITVKRVPDGKVSNFLHDHFAVGDEITAKSPAGKFTVETISQDKILLLSAGSGITPMLSMLKSLVDKNDHRDVVFFHSARSEKDLIALDEVAALAKQHGNCRVSYTLTQNAKPDWQDYQGHLSTQMLGNIPALTERDVMVCGPEGFRESAKAMLLELGLPEKQFHFESFGKRFNKTPEAKPAPANVNILFDSWNKSVAGNSKMPILDQGEDAGLILPYSCRGGMCGRCKVKLESGEVRQLATDGLMPGEQEQGYILACSSIPQSDIVVSKG